MGASTNHILCFNNRCCRGNICLEEALWRKPLILWIRHNPTRASINTTSKFCYYMVASTFREHSK